MRALVICHDFPYPPNHGGRYDMLYRLISLKKLGFRIDAIFTVANEYPSPNDIKQIQEIIDTFEILKRNRSFIYLFHLIPFQAKSRDINFRIDKFSGNFYDFVLLEDFYVYPLFEKIKYKINFNSILIRIHNDNFKYFIELGRSTKKILKKIYFFSEAIKFKVYEKKILNTEKDIWLLPISYDEFHSLKNIYPDVIWLPPALDLSKIKDYKEKSNNNLLFIGNLFTENNIHAIYWFIRNIHPILTKKIRNYNLIIAGNTGRSNIIKNIIKKYNKYDNIILFESPSELDPIYQKGTIFINPTWYGAGVKMKNLDAIINGLPVITTPKGNEGTGLKNREHVLISTNKKEWLINIESLLKDKKLREKLVINSQKFINNQYNHEAKLQEILEKVL
ncbi:MAG TPA: glycosyltransferase [Bacteroidia bacterium]|nr:glycosyltransferase [Bacteroidia bacterium]